MLRKRQGPWGEAGGGAGLKVLYPPHQLSQFSINYSKKVGKGKDMTKVKNLQMCGCDIYLDGTDERDERAAAARLIGMAEDTLLINNHDYYLAKAKATLHGAGVG